MAKSKSVGFSSSAILKGPTRRDQFADPRLLRVCIKGGARQQCLLLMLFAFSSRFLAAELVSDVMLPIMQLIDVLIGAQLLSLSADDVNFTVNSMVYLTCNVTVNLTLLSAQETLLQLSIEHLSVKLESEYISLYGYAENETSVFEDFIKWNSTLDLSDAGVYLCRAQIGINKQTVSFNVAEQGCKLSSFITI